MEALYFGSAEARLYGVLHPAARQVRPRKAVLLCYPSNHEYMRAHWAFRKLAGLLAREGFTVLRFDYFGTGDSAGEFQDASIARWCADIREAADELKDLAEVREISIVGYRLGAALAAQACADGLAVRDLVLWEPVVDGDEHVRALRRIEKQTFGMLRHGPRVQPHELLGFVWPTTLADDVRGVSLGEGLQCRANRIIVVGERSEPQLERAARNLRDKSGNPPEVHIVPEDARGALDGVLLSSRALQAITESLVGVAA